MYGGLRSASGWSTEGGVNLRRFDGVDTGLYYFNGVTGDQHAGTGFGYELHVFYDEPIKGFGAIRRQSPVRSAIQFTEGDAAIDEVTAVLLGMDVTQGRGRIRSEFTNDLFEDVFQCD